MLYLSQLPLNDTCRHVRLDLADCVALHMRVLSAFPDDPAITSAREHFGVLYRVESRTGDGTRILVQSATRPDWSHLPQGYLRMPPDEPKRIDHLYAQIATGQELLFRLRANPTRRISDRNREQPDRWRGKRVELRGEKSQIDWLHGKSDVGGFALVAVRTAPDVANVRTLDTASRVKGRRQERRLTFGSVVFEGRLRVTDVNIFRRVLAEGIGSGKAFGFGLLSVAPC